MKIAVVSKADASGGGASRVAEDVVREMKARGHEATHFSAWSHGGFGWGPSPLYGGRAARTAINLAHKTSRRIGFGETVPFEYFPALARLRRFDAVHFHDTSSVISPFTIGAVARRVPTAWTFHDCSPFTGGCIYPQMAGCERYKAGCGGCPLQGEWPVDGLLDTTPTALEARKRLHSGLVRGVAPSDWMADQAYGSGFVKTRPTVLSNMIDTDVFREAVDRRTLRRKLGLPEDGLILAVSAGNISDVRKGVKDALDTAVALSSEKPWIVLIGKPDRHTHEHLGGVGFTATGFVHARAELAEWLQATDAFLLTSKADNQPLAVMEAMACGTPVYGWPTGGVPEMVDDGATGRMVSSLSVADLAEALRSDRASGALAAMRPATRSAAERKFGRETFGDAHVRLYGEMTGTAE